MRDSPAESGTSVLRANQGRILIGDQDICNVDLTSLRRAISIVPQDSVLFHDTIKHNLHYGNLGQRTRSYSRLLDWQKSTRQ
ncbi:hypothetical protein NQ317_002418 [Molorchus minor]|uniref:ABC transporter domain-containing protein n=1 Tax=Molorchus minor TaxID=1323400 RepID=A0ABQ9JJY2_9CUCU|nr:hypothetical protein NQ317_002418 [Molorchus minor]